MVNFIEASTKIVHIGIAYSYARGMISKFEGTPDDSEMIWDILKFPY